MDYNKTLQKYINNKKIYFGKAHKRPSKAAYQFFIIIPAYSEKEYIFKTLQSIDNQNILLLKKLLVVIIINNSKSDTKKIINNNKISYNKLINNQYNFEFVAIDCYSSQYALSSQISGVGIARKIGMDYCVKYGFKDSLFCSLDADTTINKNYLDIINKEFIKIKFSAAVVNFSHQLTDNINLNRIITEYENILKNIAYKIQNTGSPYGYVSIGSTIVCTCEAYIAIGGIQPKKATEDFYFLQQLAKYNFIYQIKNILVYPSSRAEQRVYLGTGYRMKNFSKYNKFNDLAFSEEGYKSLKLIYNIIDKNWNTDHLKICKLFKNKDLKIYNYLCQNNFMGILIQIKNNTKNKIQFINQFHNWFDSLKIYKFLKMYVKN